MKKAVKELFLIIIILFIVVDLRIYTPILKLSQIIFPQYYSYTKANIVDIKEERWRMVEGVVYTKHTIIEYTVGGKKYVSKLYFRSSDKEGGVVNVNVCKVYPDLIFRNNIGMPTTSEIVLIITLVQTFIYLIKIRLYEPEKVEKVNKEWVKKARKDMPELYIFLKKNKSIDLLNELMMIQDKYYFKELNKFGLFINENIYAIISETEKEWENGHKLDYIIIGDTDEKFIMYKKDEGFIYSYNKKTFKYNFEADGLVKYLKLLGFDGRALDIGHQK